MSLTDILNTSHRRQNQDSSNNTNTGKRNQTVANLPRVDKTTSSKTPDVAKTDEAPISRIVNLTNIDRTTTPRTVNLTNVDRAMKPKTAYLTKIDRASDIATPSSANPPHQMSTNATEVPRSNLNHHPTANTTKINPKSITQFPHSATPYLRSKVDQTFASRQMAIDVLPTPERSRQDRWVQAQIKLMGPCPANYNWVRRDKYYQCEGLHHVVTDLSLAVGRGAMFLHPSSFLPSLKQNEPVWGPYFKKNGETGKEDSWIWGGRGAEKKPGLAPDWFVGSEVGFEREEERRAFEDTYWKAVGKRNPHMAKELREETQNVRSE